MKIIIIKIKKHANGKWRDTAILIGENPVGKKWENEILINKWVNECSKMKCRIFYELKPKITNIAKLNGNF